MERDIRERAEENCGGITRTICGRELCVTDRIDECDKLRLTLNMELKTNTLTA